MSGRGWALVRALGLAIAVVALAPLSPLVLVFVPLAVFLLAYHFRNPVAVGVAALVLLAAFGGVPEDPSPVWYAERAWALLVAGGFIVAGVLRPSAGVLVRSLAGIGVGIGAVGVSSALRPGLISSVDWWVETQMSRVADEATTWLGQGSEGWTGLGAAVREVIEVQVLLYPALLALATLAALAVGWYVVDRLSGAGEALGPLREFRFRDELVWLLIAGLLLFLLPVGEVAERLGENVMAFMGGLYLLRGVAVLLWVGAALVTSGWIAALWAAAALLFYPVVVGAALLMGLTDTWLDLRERLRRARDAG